VTTADPPTARSLESVVPEATVNVPPTTHSGDRRGSETRPRPPTPNPPAISQRSGAGRGDTFDAGTMTWPSLLI